MEINVRTLLPVLLFFFLKESSAQTVHNVFTYTSKLMEELECTFTSTLVQWTEQREDGLSTRLFLYDVTNRLAQKETTDSKYDNFDYSIEGRDRFNLVIKNVDQGDAGRYQCNPITTDIVTFDVTVEDLPKSMNINCTESNVCMPSAGKETVPKITCVCTATGVSSSQFEIQWDGVDITSTSSTAYGSSSISSEITLQPPNGTSGISCSLTGYRSEIPERLISYSYTFSPPVCTLTSECPSDGTSASLICSCSKGSPSKVHGYSFYDSQMLLIGTQLDSSLQVDSEKNETFYCKGCNGVLHDQFVSHALNCNQAKSSALLLRIFIISGILLVLLVAVILVVRKVKKRRKVENQDGKRNVQPQPKDGPGEEIQLLKENGDRQNLQGHQDAGNTTPTQSGGPAPKEHKKITIPTPSADPASKQHKKPDNKSRSAGSSGVGPGKVTEHQNNAGNENIAKKKPPVLPKTKGENNMKSKQTEIGKAEESKSADKTITNRGDREVTGHQNNAGNENIEKKKPPVVPKTKGENKRTIANSIPVYADVNKQREVTGHQNNAGNGNIEKKKPPVVPKKNVENNQSADNNTRTHGRDSTEQAAPPSHARTGGDGKSDSDTQEGNEKNDSSSQTNSDQEPSKHLLPGVESNVDPENYNGNEAHLKNDKLGGDEPTVDPENHGKEADGKNDMMSNDSNTPTVTDANSQQKDVLIASAPAFL